MEHLLNLVISVAGSLIAKAMPSATQKRIQQVRREHRVKVTVSVITATGLLVYGVVAGPSLGSGRLVTRCRPQQRSARCWPRPCSRAVVI